MTIRPRRSVLYMPASNARALEKARALNADAVIFDLEDSVAPDAKQTARRQALEAIRQGGYGRCEIILRINALTSEWGRLDLDMAGEAGADAVLVPKVSSPDDLVSVQNRLNGGTTAIWAMMETPAAILGAMAIAAARRDVAPAFAAMVLGTNDLAKETRVALKPGRWAYMPWMMQVVAAGRAHGLDVIDGVYNDLDDPEGFGAECEQASELGMDGKTLIHPRQIETANAVFAPKPDEIEWARKVCAVFDDPANAGIGVARLEGRMVERLHADMARRVLAIRDALAR